MKNLNESKICDRCGKPSDILICGEHHLADDKRKPFQICSQCDDDVFFGGKLWNQRELDRIAKSGRRRDPNPSPAALKMRKSRANKAAK